MQQFIPRDLAESAFTDTGLASHDDRRWPNMRLNRFEMACGKYLVHQYPRMLFATQVVTRSGDSTPTLLPEKECEVLVTKPRLLKDKRRHERLLRFEF